MTAGEARASISALDLPEKYKTERFALLAELYREMGNEELAVTYGREAVQVEPEDLQTRFLLGRIYQQYGRQEEAIGAYRDILAIDSDNRLARNALAALLN